MLRFPNFNIVFQEIPGEVTLAINISNCPNHCKGCHSPYLWEDTGKELNEDTMMELLDKYGNSITCVCFMGGDAEPLEVEKLAVFIQTKTEGKLKTGWYSGKNTFSSACSLKNFNYLKLGPYIKERGGLTSPDTNQRFYCIEQDRMIDKTFLFQTAKKNLL
ncbi:MAG: anaerobic ribonucleoside-triphosphate reductase activating protein [Bacteroidales bacterium]|nr:anaerobic ribonucleoside-triphosphate reductase activating protein [Bacteroidales bacterium]